jgi:intermembrane space import and assembly protein 40
VPADLPFWPFDTQALDRRIAEALDCPCVEDLKAGPCGELFVSAFTCHQKSRAEPKGCDCLDVSLAFAVRAVPA